MSSMSTPWLNICMAEANQALLLRRVGPRSWSNNQVKFTSIKRGESWETLMIDIDSLKGCSAVAESWIRGNVDDISSVIADRLQNYNVRVIETFYCFLQGSDISTRACEKAQERTILFHAKCLRLAHDFGCADFITYFGIRFAVHLDAMDMDDKGLLYEDTVTLFHKCVNIIYNCGHSSADHCTLKPFRHLLVLWFWSNWNRWQVPYGLDPNDVRPNAAFALAVQEWGLYGTEDQHILWADDAMIMLEKMYEDLGMEYPRDPDAEVEDPPPRS